jgi:hypothetical protein
LKAKPWTSTSGGLAVETEAGAVLLLKSWENQPVTADELHAGPRTTTFLSSRRIVATGHAPNALQRTKEAIRGARRQILDQHRHKTRRAVISCVLRSAHV